MVDKRNVGCPHCNCGKSRFTVAHALRDTLRKDFVDAAEKARRIGICVSCDRLLPTGNCLECGCFVQVKAKFRRAACDLGRW